MTSKQTTELTQEEQAELAISSPGLLEAINTNKLAAPALLTFLRHKKRVGEVAQEQAVAIRAEVAAEMPSAEQGTLTTWCGYPTDMTRCSPFFPMNSSELGERRYLENYLITSANWGEIRYTGPQLSTYEEDVLLALLALLDSKKQYRETSYYIEGIYVETNEKITEVCEVIGEEEICEVFGEEALKYGDKTYTYRGPARPLLKLLGYEKAGKREYQRLVQMLKRLTVAGVDISISTGKTNSGKRREPRSTQMAAMLAGVHWDNKEKVLTATVNPFFYETYMAGRVTLIDLAKRMSLKGVIAKSLYRFVQSHRQNRVFQGHYLTLADALNMDRDQPMKKTRQLLKTAIGELIRQGILTKQSHFIDQDIVALERTPEALPTPQGDQPKPKIC